MGRLYGILWVTAALLAGFLVMAAPGRAANGAGSPMDGTAPAPATLENGFEVPAGPLPGARHSDGPGEPEGAPAPPRTGTAPPERVEGVVYIIPIEGTIDEGLAVFVRRALREAREAGAVAVLVEINTFGGRVDSATDIKDALVAVEVPVIAFVTQRAWSAGALIALGARYLAMAPGTSIGAAEPRPADPKTISALRREFEAAAEHRGRDPRIAGAMVDASVVIEGLTGEGEILTLSAQQARELGFADFVGMRRAEVLEAFGITATALVETEPNWAERIARFLTDPVISSILLTLGFLGLITELTSPGWGVPGTGGLVALALFFGARFIAGLAGLEIIITVLLGLALIALEVFVIPGFGVAGVAGVAALLAGIYFSFPDASSALNSLAASLLAAIVLAVVLLRFLPRTRAWQRLVLETRIEEAEEDRQFREAVTGEEGLLTPGRVGRALTALRPAGTIEVGERRFDAVTEGEFVEAGSPVRIVLVEGRRIVVRKLGDDPSPSKPSDSGSEGGSEGGRDSDG